MTPSENPGILRLETQGLRLWRAGQEAVSLDDATGDLGKNCAFAVPADRARLTHITVRSDEHRHLKQSLPFMLEDAVIDPVESMHFVSTPIDGERYLVALASQADMSDWLQQLGDGFEGIGVGELVAKEILGSESDLLKPFRFNRYEKGELHPTSNSPFPWS